MENPSETSAPLVLDEVRSQSLGKTITKAKGPFEYAHKAALALEPEALGAVLYVQGFLVVLGEPEPLEHAWVEVGAVRIDPNLRFLKKQATDLSYFPAHRLSVENLKAAIEEAQEDYPEDSPLPIYAQMPYDYYGDLFLGDRHYARAFEMAQAKSRELNRPARPVKRSK